MKARNSKKPTIRRLGSAAAASLLVISGLSLALPANAQTVNGVFDVSCTQSYVNDGNPFTVGVDVDVSLPDVIYAGDVLYPEVSVALVLPPEVASSIIDYGYETMEGFVDVTVEITDPQGATSELTASSFPLPLTTPPNPAASFPIVAEPTFPSYTVGSAGNYTITVQGSAVTVTGITLRDSADRTYVTGDFDCTVDGTIEIGAIEVQVPSTRA